MRISLKNEQQHGFSAHLGSLVAEIYLSATEKPNIHAGFLDCRYEHSHQIKTL